MASGALRARLTRLAGLAPVASARMSGSSLAAPSAVGLVTDFLDAAYYARPREQRDVDDLRLALAILTTRWHRLDRRLGARDLRAFHRAFGRDRLRSAAARRGRGVLDRAELLEGGERLLGAGFADGYGDPCRRGWGIVFASESERERFLPELRLRRGALGALTPPRRPGAEQRWHTYRPVPASSTGALLDFVTAPARWPDAGCELGRFTPVRRGGLAGQTFEIEVAATPTPRTPVFVRGYVTVTAVLDGRTAPAELAVYIDSVARAMAAAQGEGEEGPLPAGAEARAVVELTTHRGHFLGAAISRLIVFEHEGRAFIRDVGSWDPLPAHLALAYRAGGRAAQRAFWGDGAPERSMLHQFAALAGGPR